MSEQHVHQFFELYQQYRYQDQLKFYDSRVKEFERAHKEANGISIVLLGLTFVVGGLSAISDFSPGFKLACQIVAVILPILSTTIIAYDGLYDFERQAKLYDDSIDNLHHAKQNLGLAVLDSLDEGQYTEHVKKYVEDVEKVFHDEQGQWGQLAKKPKSQQEP